MKIKQDELDDITDWIKLNYDELMKMWKIHETGDGDIISILTSLKRV